VPADGAHAAKETTIGSPDAACGCDHDVRRAQARDALRSGTLPATPPAGVWGGPGQGIDCPVCRVAIDVREMELELEFARDGMPERHHVHVRCFEAWDLERRSADPLPEMPDVGTIPGREARTSGERGST
jgi:hypothetical protein